MTDEVDEDYRSPLGVTTDEDGENVVRVCVVIPGLKKKTFSSEAKNAVVHFDPSTWGFDLRVEMEVKNGGPKRVEKYRYLIKKLPDAIVPEQCSRKVKDNQVVLLLHKEKARSWSRELNESGLEQFNEDEEQD